MFPMLKGSTNLLLALLGGVLLALMIKLNGELARYSSALFSSWVAHGIGALAALLIVRLISTKLARYHTIASSGKAPRWSYLGGIPGAFTVVLAGITVNSPLGLAGSLALMMVGQVIFGLLTDQRGWFGVPRRPLTRRDGLVTACVLAGSALIIFSR